VPVIAIFTKFDDLMYQVCDMDDMDLDDMDLDDNATRRIAEKEVEEKFRKPLNACTFPPRADVCFEGKYRFILCQKLDQTVQRSTFIKPCILTKQVNIRTR
jgi:hypothetical protein